MIALVSRDRLQLPCASADAGSGSRASLVDTADRLVKLLNPGLKFAPHTFLIMQQSNLLAVACPLLGRYPQCRAFSYAKWSSLSDLAGSVAYTPVASAFARVAAYCRHGVPIPDVTVRDGARAAKRVLTLPWTPSAVPAAWPLQLQYLTAVDTLFRRRLAATPKTHPHYAYLVEWIDQVDTSLNASIPFCLRGMSQVEFGNKRLLNAPFVSSVVVNKTDPPTFPKTPSTSFKPTSVRQILTDESILKIVKFLRHLVLAMQYIKAGKKIPSSLRAKLKTLVIPQSGFHPLAQDVTWDLRQRHPDGHFMPLDVERPIDSHLHTKALFDALGESYPDQSLRYQILNGALFFANDDAMQIVICPHLLSIADGFPLMEKTFIRREKLGYLTFTSTEHEIEIGQEMVILALGIVPVRVTAQGSRARKLTPLNPRGIADAGGPHDFGPDADGVPVKSLNDLIGWRSEVDGKPKFNRENKPTMQQLMNNISVLKFAGRIFNEPLLLFNDDSADAFNQFHLHRSQIRMTSILWLKITEVVSKCEYTHIIEPTFGFGFSNASDFCQRFNDGLQHLVETEMAALEEIEWAKVTDPSQRAWMSARDQLTVKTGTQQRKLYFMLVFTDDPLFAAVGFDRCIRLICCWRNVIVLAGLRMTIAAKRQAGSNVLWIGFRTYGTFGAVVIPDEKRMRAIRQLRASADGALVTVEDAKSIAGLLEHLCPFAAQLRSSMYQMYEPHKMYWSKPNTYAFVPSEQYRIVCSRWVDRLVECSGVSCLVVILSRRPDSVGSHLYVMSSDAAKDGTDTPGVGGYMHGRAWCIQLERSDVVGPFQISINALDFWEFMATSCTLGLKSQLQMRDSCSLLTRSPQQSLAPSSRRRRSPCSMFTHACSRSRTTSDFRISLSSLTSSVPPIFSRMPSVEDITCWSVSSQHSFALRSSGFQRISRCSQCYRSLGTWRVGMRCLLKRKNRNACCRLTLKAWESECAGTRWATAHVIRARMVLRPSYRAPRASYRLRLGPRQLPTQLVINPSLTLRLYIGLPCRCHRKWFARRSHVLSRVRTPCVSHLLNRRTCRRRSLPGVHRHRSYSVFCLLTMAQTHRLLASLLST